MSNPKDTSNIILDTMAKALHTDDGTLYTNTCFEWDDEYGNFQVEATNDSTDSGEKEDEEDEYIPPLIPRETMHIHSTNAENHPEQIQDGETDDETDAFLKDMTWHQLTGQDKGFNTLAFAMQTVNDLWNYEQLQPKLAWKPIEVIKRTLEATTQWGKQVIKYPMQKHHVSRFPWANRRRLREEVAMDTIFMKQPGIGGYTCGQLYIGLMSRMLNFYPLKNKNGTSQLQAYQDFVHYEGVPTALHRDAAPEQKCQAITDLNREMQVKDTWSEPDHPNENPAEALGVNPLKRGVQILMNRTGALDIS